MMRKRHFRSHRAKKPVRWFSDDTCYRDIGAFTPLNTATITPTASILALHPRAIVATSALVAEVQRHTIETIRGEILLTGSQNLLPDVSSICFWHGGIRVVELDPTGAPLLYSPTSPNEADDDWMWLAHRIVMPAASVTDTPALVPAQPLDQQLVEVHIKSKRVLKENEALVLYEQATKAPYFADDIQMASSAYLRTLVSHPI